MDREIQQLFGELQRMAICATILRDVDVYFFDEPSSYLDIHERMRIVKIIQNLSESKRVIVIEHDLAVLDVLADSYTLFMERKGHLEYSLLHARQGKQSIHIWMAFCPNKT